MKELIEKMAKALVENYGLDEYYSTRITLVRDEIDSIFADKESNIEADEYTQVNLIGFMRPTTKKSKKK